MKGSQGFQLTKLMAVNTGLRNCAACDLNDNAETPIGRFLSVCYTSKFATKTVTNRTDTA